MNRKHERNNTPSRMKSSRCMRVWTLLVLTLCLLTVPAFAAGSNDPLTIVNNLSDFIFSCIRAIGIIILGWGIVQVGMSVRATTPASARRASSACLGDFSSRLQKRSSP